MRFLASKQPVGRSPIRSQLEHESAFGRMKIALARAPLCMGFIPSEPRRKSASTSTLSLIHNDLLSLAASAAHRSEPLVPPPLSPPANQPALKIKKRETSTIILVEG